jgi:putative ABC transport system permease protein
MLKNYLSISVRSLLKNKTFSFINAAGLSIGLSCVMIIAAYVQMELSYDKFHPQYENIYRITTSWINDGSKERTATNHAPIAPLLIENVSNIQDIVRVYPASGLISTDKKTKQRENLFCFADSVFFKVFKFNAIEGTLLNSLDKPMSVVLTSASALKYFGSTDIIGKEIFYETQLNSEEVFSFNVTAVIEDVPQNSHFKFDFLASFNSINSITPWVFHSWHFPPMYVYVKTTQQTEAEDINRNLGIVEKHLPDYTKDEQRSYAAQPLGEIHLRSDLENEWQANSSHTYITIFTFIAIFILLIACINYTNLAIAKSIQRAVEVGVRKVNGSSKRQLIGQFLCEALVMTLLAFGLSLIITQLTLELFFRSFLNKELSILFISHGFYPLVVVSSIVLITLLSGFFPAFYLSSLRPAKALKGISEKAGTVLGLRKGLVTFQFFISALLLIGTVVVIQQIDFMRSKKLGFSKDQIITILLSDQESQLNYAVLKNLLSEEPIVEQASVSATVPGGNGFYGWEVSPEGFENRKDIVLKSISTDEDFLKTYNITLLQGRDFSKSIVSDKEQAFILNQAAAKKFGWENPIGKEFKLTFHTTEEVIRKGKVIGMVEDFHFQSLYNRVEPLIIFINTHPHYADFLSVRISPGNTKQSVEKLEKIWKTFNSDKPFEFSFLDEELNKLYESETKTGKLLTLFTGISIIISCLGLFGLAAFSVQQRTKEIGIRKVLGAGVFSITRLLTTEFVWLVLAANMIAIPFGWYLASQWLEGFAYSVAIDPFIFVLTLIIILVITIVTVSYQAISAALNDPIKSLRNE